MLTIRHDSNRSAIALIALRVAPAVTVAKWCSRSGNGSASRRPLPKTGAVRSVSKTSGVRLALQSARRKGRQSRVPPSAMTTGLRGWPSRAEPMVPRCHRRLARNLRAPVARRRRDSRPARARVTGSGVGHSRAWQGGMPRRSSPWMTRRRCRHGRGPVTAAEASETPIAPLAIERPPHTHRPEHSARSTRKPVSQWTSEFRPSPV
jgi:hypothetical protein